jgi:phosphinothricin acetyltransferase
MSLSASRQLTVALRSMGEQDWPAVSKIYGEGIAGGNSTFEQTIPEWPAWDFAHLPACRLVAERNGEVIGWAALSPVSKRHVYRGVAEVSVYIAGAAQRSGVGRALLDGLIGLSEVNGFWTLQGGIFPENVASLRLFESRGFRKVGVREKIGQMHGKWRNTVLVERRSKHF